MNRAAITVLLTLVLLLTGCSGGADPDAAEPDGSSSAVETGAPEVGLDQQFTLDDTAQFDDRLEVEIAGSFATPPEAGVDGPGGGNEVVTASVRIENNTPEPYDPRNTTITARYGTGAGTPAAGVTDADQELTGTFAEVIAVGDEGVAAAGFAVPTKGLERVTFIVDLHDDTHDPMSFTGRVERG